MLHKNNIFTLTRDKSKDNKTFNCKQAHEKLFVYNLYSGHEELIKKFLERKCEDWTIRNFTHMQVYELIKDELGLPVPN